MGVTENGMVFPQTIEIGLVILWYHNSTSWYIPQIIESRALKKYLYTVFIAALFPVVKSRSTQVSIDGYMDKQNMVKRKDILTLQHRWTEDIMLIEIGPSQKDKYCMTPLIRGT